MKLKLQEIPVSELRAWAMQPRKNFEAGPLQELGKSIESQGVLQPLIVRPVEVEAGSGVHFEIVAGERRWRGAKLVSVEIVPCVVRDLTDKEAIEIAVTENIARKNFDAVEEAEGYKAMLDLGWTQQEIAERNGKNKMYVSRLIGLVDLEPAIKEAVRCQKISYSTAAVLANVSTGRREQALQQVVDPGDGVGAMPEKMAIARIRREFIDPEKKAAKWDKTASKMRVQAPNLKVLDYWDSKALSPAEWRNVEDRPEEKELAVHARDWPEQQIPTWGELAEKHGAEQMVIARQLRIPGSDGEWTDEVKAVWVVKVEPLKVAELTQAETALREIEKEAKLKGAEVASIPEYLEIVNQCVFPISGGKGRHEQSSAKKKGAQVVEKAKGDLEKEINAMLLAWYRQWTHPTDGSSPAAIEQHLPALAKWLGACGGLMHLDALAVSLGIDLETMGAGDAAAGRKRWVESLTERRGWRAVVYLTGAGVLLACAKENKPEELTGILERLREALGLEPVEEEVPSAE